MSSATSLGSQLSEGPTDGVSGLRYSASSDLLLATSWDGTARLYDTAEPRLRHSFEHDAPVLDGALQQDAACFTGGLDGVVRRFDFAGGPATSIGSHGAAVRCVEWLAERQLLVSGSWDASLRAWDPRAAAGQSLVVNIPLPGKVFSMSQSHNRLAVATSARQNLAFDIRRIETGQAELQRESSLKFQTRCLRCSPDGQGFAVGSVEGRVAVEYFDGGEASQARKFAFKCHRAKSAGGEDTAFPVNAIAFHPQLGTFATGGCDGVVNVWDPENKKRLFQITGYPAGVAALAFNHDGSQLAVAASYTFESGERDHPPDAIFVRQVQESEVRPKLRR